MSIPLIQSTGRRKRAVARVNLRPGAGVITVNKRPVAEYFPSETHRMVLTEPLRITNTTEIYDIDCRIDGGGVSGQAGALRHGIARALVEPRSRDARRAQAGRVPHARRSQEGIQEVRPQEGPQGPAVLQALIRSRLPVAQLQIFSTCAVPSGVAHVAVFGTMTPALRHRRRAGPAEELTDELVAALGAAAAKVLGSGQGFVIGRDTRSPAPGSRPRWPAGLAAGGGAPAEPRAWCRPRRSRGSARAGASPAR